MYKIHKRHTIFVDIINHIISIHIVVFKKLIIYCKISKVKLI